MDRGFGSVFSEMERAFSEMDRLSGEMDRQFGYFGSGINQGVDSFFSELSKMQPRIQIICEYDTFGISYLSNF